MLTVFGDESHDARTERVFSLAGLIGYQADWDALEAKWLGLMQGRVFHAADCESDRGAFAETPHE